MGCSYRKDKAGQSNKHLKDIVETMKHRKIPFIQPDENDHMIRELTDFNDMAIELGKSKVHRLIISCLLYTSPSPRDRQKSRMPSSA